MIPLLYEENEKRLTRAVVGWAVAGITVVGDENGRTPFTTEILARLSDAVYCEVLRNFDGMYELEMEYPNTGIFFERLKTRRIIYTGEPFRIYKIARTSKGTSIIYARHISYDLSGFECPRDLSATYAEAAVRALNEYAAPFTLTYSGALKNGNWTTTGKPPGSIRSWMAGKEGSIADVYLGHWYFNGFNCNFSQGSNGITVDSQADIRYGKNIIKLTAEESSDDMYTAIRAYYFSDGTYVESDLVSLFTSISETRVFLLDATERYADEVPTAAALKQYAQSYASSHNLSKTKITLKIDYENINQLKGSIGVGTKVNVVYPEFDINTRVMISETTYDVLKERYTNVKVDDTNIYVEG